MPIALRKDLIAFFLVIILAIFFGYHGVYKNNLKKMDELRKQIKQEKKKNELLQDLSKLDRKGRRYTDRFFSSTEITPLLDRISELAEETGIIIENFNPLPVVYREDYTELPVHIPLRCAYHQLGKFLSLLESNREFIQVKELKIQKSTVTDPRKTKNPKINLTLCGFYLKK